MNYKNPVQPNQARAVAPPKVTRLGAYTFGDGDPGAKAASRPGADDNKRYKSLENKGEAHYPRHHP